MSDAETCRPSGPTISGGRPRRLLYPALALLVLAACAGAATAQSFCSGDLLLDQPPGPGVALASEATCVGCQTDQIVRAESFVLDRTRLITEVVLWGYYADGGVPELETWTVVLRSDASSLPAGILAAQTLVPVSRVATGASEPGTGSAEYRWLLRLDDPVQLTPGAPGQTFWLEVFHDSPDLGVVAALGSSPSAPARSAVAEASAPGSAWIATDVDLAMQVCGLDLAWRGLVVPRFELDESNPSDATLWAVRNVTDRSLDLEAAYYGDGRVEDGALRTDRFVLAPRATRPINVNLDTTGLDPDGDDLADGFIVLREVEASTGQILGPSNLVGDFTRVDFTNDFASGERLVAPEDFCRVQEIRFVDFGSGSEFNVVLRNPPQSQGQTAFSVDIYDEAGDLLGQRSVQQASHTQLLEIDDLIANEPFGTLVFDFSPSGSGVVTGAYSAFGRFSIEVRGACRD